MALLVSPSGDVILDMATGEACSRGQVATLGPHEAAILGYMIERRGAPCPMPHLMYDVCVRHGRSTEEHTIWSTIEHIRRKLGAGVIRSRRHMGYWVP